MTRCKVQCTETTGRRVYGTDVYHTAKLSAVYDSNPESENGKFFKYPPSLTLDLTLKEQHFEAGKSYYLDFTEVPNG